MFASVKVIHLVAESKSMADQAACAERLVQPVGGEGGGGGDSHVSLEIQGQCVPREAKQDVKVMSSFRR